MKAGNVQFCLAGVLALAAVGSALATQDVVSSDTRSGLIVDARVNVVVRDFEIGETIPGFAWNNTENWDMGGDTGVDGRRVVIKKWKMNPVSTRPETWTPQSDVQSLVEQKGEGVTADFAAELGAWKVELFCDGEGAARQTAYFRCTGCVVATETEANIPLDTRDYVPRRPQSLDEILQFAYDTNWVDSAKSVSSVTIAPFDSETNKIIEAAREDVPLANVYCGTSVWMPQYRGFYQAQLIESVSANASVTNVVNIDLTALTNLPERDFATIRVTFPVGDTGAYETRKYETLEAALADYRANGGVRFELIGDYADDLTLQPGDDIVFEGNGHLLNGAITVPAGADLTILDGKFSADPTAYLPNQGSEMSGPAAGTYTVTSLWQVGAPNAADIKAYLDGDSLKFVGYGAMMGWGASVEKLPPWDAYDAQVASVIVPQLVTSVGSEAFSNCVNLVNVTLPGAIQDVGRSSFAACNASGTQATKGVGFVTVDYAPEKAGVSGTFEMRDMTAVDGKLTGGTFSYDPERNVAGNEVATGYATFTDRNATYTIGDVWAISGDKKYGDVFLALGDAADGSTLTIVRGTIGAPAWILQPALDRGVVLDGSAWFEVGGTVTNGTVKCPLRVLDGGITGGDFHEVTAPAGSISGGIFDVRPAETMIAEGCAVVEVMDGATKRYRVVRLGEDEVAYPKVVEGLVANGAEQVGVETDEGVTLVSGDLKATEWGVYTATVKPAEGKTWPADGGVGSKTYKWGLAPALDLPDGAKIVYDPETDGWKITLEKDVVGPISVPDSLGKYTEGRVELDLNGHTVETPKAVQPGATDGTPAVLITHTDGFDEPTLALTVTGPGALEGGDGADGVPSHKAGGDGAPSIGAEPGAKSGALTVGGDVSQTPGEKGADYAGDETDLLMTIIDSRDEYLAIAIPYANRSSSAGTAKPTLDSLVRKDELATGDEAYVYDHDGRTIAKYRLDSSKAWQPVTVVEVTEAGWVPKTGANPCELEPGYGFWLRRGETSRPNKVYLWGYEWKGYSGHWTVSLKGSEGGERGKTLVSNPYGDVWDLNDTSRVNWPAVAANGDWIQLNGGASSIYQYKNGKWKPYTIGTVGTKIPAGYGFWYIRAKNASAQTLSFK